MLCCASNSNHANTALTLPLSTSSMFPLNCLLDSEFFFCFNWTQLWIIHYVFMSRVTHSHSDVCFLSRPHKLPERRNYVSVFMKKRTPKVSVWNMFKDY